jgi:hypothetical protein
MYSRAGLDDRSNVQRIKQNVKSRLAEYLQTKGITSNTRGLIRCFWHEDKNPSCKVNDDYVYCFSCNDSGDIFKTAAALLGVPCDREHFREICADIETSLGIPPSWKPRKRAPGEPKSVLKFSQSAVYRDMLLKDFAAALDNGNQELAYHKAVLLLALFMLPEGERAPAKPRRSLEDKRKAYGSKDESWAG